MGVNVSLQVKVGSGGSASTFNFNKTDDALKIVPITIPAGATDYVVTETIPDLTKLAFFAIAADVGLVTLKTNSNGSPVDTIKLPASLPLIYGKDANGVVAGNITTPPIPFSAAVTSFHFANAGAVPVNVTYYILTHETTP